MVKKIKTRDINGKLHVYQLPEYRVMPWEKGGAFDVAMILALAVIATALYYV